MRIWPVAITFASLIGGLFVSAPAAAVDTQRSAEQLLDKIAGADRATYHAQQIVAYFGEPQSNAVLDVRSSAKGRFVRAESGSDVTRMWSTSQMGAVSDKHANFEEDEPSEIGVSPSRVLAKYDVSVGNPVSLLGVYLVPLTFARRSDDTVVERWWVHAKSGVVYRRALYGSSNKLVGMSTIIDMHWGDPGPGDPPDPALARNSAAESTDATDAPKRLSSGYDFWKSYKLTIDGKRCDQWVYSDGLHALSVFRTKGNLKTPDGFTSADVDGHRMWTGPGPGTWAWEGAGRTWMLVAEEPALDAAQLTRAFPKGGPSFWARLGSVWSRLFGVFD